METELKFKAVLFDLDGTLIEFKFPVVESRRALFDFLSKKGYDSTGFSDRMRTQELIDSAESQWRNSELLKVSQDFQDVRASIFRILDDFELKSMPSSKPFHGALEVLQSIRQNNGLTGLVTNSGRIPVDRILTEFGFKPLMNIVVTRDEMRRMKPSPDGLLEAKRKLGVEKWEIIYVGDSLIDIEAARSAGIKCASLPTGSHSLESLQKQSPDYILEKLEDLEQVIGQDTT